MASGRDANCDDEVRNCDPADRWVAPERRTVFFSRRVLALPSPLSPLPERSLQLLPLSHIGPM